MQVQVIRSALLAALCILAAFCPAAHADWAENGIAIADAANDQTEHRVTTDMAGGMIIGWRDFRSGNHDVYVQRIDRYGNKVWQSGGVPVCTEPQDQKITAIVSDGMGGAIMVWGDYRSLDWDVYAQRVDGQGNILWSTNGVVVCNSSGLQQHPYLCADGYGGAYYAWEDRRRGNTDFDIYIQHFDVNGTPSFAPNGISVCTHTTGMKMKPQIDDDGSGGAIVVWQDTRGQSDPNNCEALWIQRIDILGNRVWADEGAAVIGGAVNGYLLDTHCFITDGAGGAIIAWSAYCGTCPGWNIWAQRINSSGSRVWSSTAKQICYTAGNSQKLPCIAEDGAGGYIFAWYDERNLFTTFGDIYGQRTDSGGNTQWTTNGISICATSSWQMWPCILSGPSDGAFLTWSETAESGWDIYGQFIDNDGIPRWASGGIPFCTAAGDQVLSRLVHNSFGGVICSWHDHRSSTCDIYANRFDILGSWELPSHSIQSVSDIPDDEGGWVRVRVIPSDWDNGYDPLYPVTGYNVWRKMQMLSSPAPGAVRLSVDITGILDLAAVGSLEQGTILTAEQSSLIGFPDGEWESVGYHAAAQSPDWYDFAAPTRADSMIGDTNPDTFVVTAHTEIPMNYFISGVAGGYSVDNLAPGMPLALTGIRPATGEGLVLTWKRGIETDIGRYAVYRGLSPGFEPSGDCMIASATDTFCVDNGWRPGSGYCYMVSAIDIHGNESDRAVLLSSEIEDGGQNVPAASYISQNYPNPFNPSTRITFGMSGPAYVSVRIYDPAGRLVRTIVDGKLAAGRYEEVWDGSDDRARPVSSGIYFCRMSAGQFRESIKLILLR